MLLLSGLLSTGVRIAARAQVPAPSLTFNTLTTADGLSENSVYGLVQDRRGFLWLGSQDGLNRYDGAGVRVFRNDPQQPGSLSRNYVLGVTIDSTNHLWVATGGSGVSCYNPLTDQFKTFQHAPTDPHSLSHNFVRAVFCDRAGTIWAATEDGLSRFDARSQRFCQFRHHPAEVLRERRNSIRALAQTTDGTLWVGTGEGRVSSLNLHTGYLTARPGWGITSSISALCADGAGGLWVGTEADGLFYLAPGADSPRRFRFAAGQPNALPSDAVRTIFRDRDGGVWVGTADGLARYQPLTGTFAIYQHALGQPHSLPDNKVYTLTQDRAGLLWVGTENGVSYFDARPSRFQTYPISAHGPEPVWAVTEDARGRVWVGTETQGLVCYDPATGQRQAFVHDLRQPGSLAENMVRTLRFDQQGRLWVGTQSQGLDCLLPGATRFQHFRHLPNANSLGDDQVRCLYVDDKASRLWVGTEGGLSCYDFATGRFEVYRPAEKGGPATLPSGFVHDIRPDRQGRLWLATGGGGLCQFDLKSKRFQAYRTDAHNPRSLSSDFVRAVQQDQRGRLWIGTEGGGLCRLEDLGQGIFKTYREPQGLPADLVFGVQADAQHRIWLSSNKGLACLTPGTGNIRTFDTRDGLPQDEFNAGAAGRGPSGRLYFGGTNGLVAFQADAVYTNTVPPPVLLTGFRKFNQPVALDTAITERRALRLGPKDYSFSLEFAGLNFRHPDKNRYAYRLDGFDPAWVSAGNHHEATYTNLDPGTYTFRVRAANNDGVWNLRGTALTVIIAPAWYQTWWFRVLAIATAGGLLYLAYHLRVRQLLALAQVRQNIARDLHDDIGSTLSSISMLSQIARTHYHSPHPERAADMLEQIGDSAHRMLEAMDDIVWSINPRHDSLDEVVIRMRRFASEVLEAHDIDFTFRVGMGVAGLKLPMRARREFYLLYKEAVNNLAKYAHCQHARLELTYTHGHLYLLVQDDGVGFDPGAPARGGGNGLVNMRARAEALKGQFDLQTTPGQGTTLRLRLPAGR